jgi:ATP-dependent DNA helicase PIF1
MQLSKNQLAAYNAIKSYNNVFLSGPGGSGKTSVIRVIYDYFTGINKKIEITALTGVAAVQLHANAKTIHSWAGIGLGDKEANFYINKINKSKALKTKWLNIDVLVIDEISMMTDKLLEILECIARTIRKKDLPFGGITVLLSGDFYQLPPVTNKHKFCFESPLFDKLFTTKIILDTIFRQSDNNLVSILNNIRLGKITKSNVEVLKKRLNIKTDNLIQPVILTPKKATVESINNSKLSNIDSEEFTFNRKVVEDLPVNKDEENYVKMLTIEEYTQELEYLEQNTMIVNNLKLKVGSQVMSIVNEIDGDKLIISNGTQGIIKNFIKGLPYVEFENGISKIVNYHTWTSHSLPCCGITQIPLVLSWALTIHKAQGSTIKNCIMNLGNDIFEAGQIYVALSRVKSLEGIFLTEFNPYKIKTNPRVKEFYNKLSL